MHTHTHPTPHTATAQRLLQRVTGSSPHPSTPPAGLNMDAELLVEDCVLEVEVDGGASASGGARRWRSYQVEGPRAEVRRRCLLVVGWVIYMEGRKG